MSVYVTSHVWHHSQLKGTALLLVLALADQANDEGVAWPSVATLASKTRLSERTVQNLLPEVLDAGEVEVMRETGGPGRPRVYRVLAPAPPVRAGHTRKGARPAPLPLKGRNLGEAKGASDAERVQSEPERVQPATEKGEDRCTQTVLNRQREPSLEPCPEPARGRARGGQSQKTTETNCRCARAPKVLLVDGHVRRCPEALAGAVNGARAGPG